MQRRSFVHRKYIRVLDKNLRQHFVSKTYKRLNLVQPVDFYCTQVRKHLNKSFSFEVNFLDLHSSGHLNSSSSFHIHHRDLPMVPFNSELNFAHFWLKNSGLCEKLPGCLLRDQRRSFH